MAEDATGLQLNARTVFLLIQPRRQRFQNDKSLNNVFRNRNGVRISTQTVRHRPHEFGLNARRPAMRVPVTRQHMQDRLDCPRIHVRWTFVTERQCYSLMSPNAVLILLIDVSWCGEYPRRNLMNIMWQNMAVRSRTRSWFGQALASNVN